MCPHVGQFNYYYCDTFRNFFLVNEEERSYLSPVDMKADPDFVSMVDKRVRYVIREEFSSKGLVGTDPKYRVFQNIDDLDKDNPDGNNYNCHLDNGIAIDQMSWWCPRGFCAKYDLFSGLNFMISLLLWSPSSVSDVHFHNGKRCRMIPVHGDMMERTFSGFGIGSMSDRMSYEYFSLQKLMEIESLLIEGVIDEDSYRDTTTIISVRDDWIERNLISSKFNINRGESIDGERSVGLDTNGLKTLFNFQNERFSTDIDDEDGPHHIVNMSPQSPLVTLHLYWM